MLKEVGSTATAARIAQDDPYAAAVASRQAASKYGLNTLCSDIEDHENNITRFAVLGHNVPKRTGKDKTTVLMQIADQAGALADVLAVLKRNGVNMTWIESFPANNDGKVQEYVFFADVEGHQADAKVKRTLEAVAKKCVRLEVLGSYPRAHCIED